MRRTITEVPGLAQNALSPVAYAVVVDETCYVSGQLSTKNGLYTEDTPAGEAARAFDLAFRILRQAGFAPADVAFVDIVLANLNDLPEVNTVFTDLFPHPCARTVSEAQRLPYGGKVKVTVTAQRTRSGGY